MTYQQAMSLLSACGTGALLLSPEGMVITSNTAADAILHACGDLLGKRLREVVPELCDESTGSAYVNIGCGAYIKRCPVLIPEDLPEGMQFVAFRDASKEALCDILSEVVNDISEAIVICDTESRILLMNSAASRIDGMDEQQVFGARIADVYRMLDGSDFLLPSVLCSQKPVLGRRQHYATRYGKSVRLITDAYPVSPNGQLLGAFNVMKDWGIVEELHNQVAVLQEQLGRAAPSATRYKSRTLTAPFRFEDAAYQDAVMCDIVAQCRRAAQFNGSLLLYGERGTEKSWIAQGIHNAGNTAAGPFVAVTCTSVASDAMRYLLLGEQGNGDTGQASHSGLIEQAKGGTLFLDEIDALDIGLQKQLFEAACNGEDQHTDRAATDFDRFRLIVGSSVPPARAAEEGSIFPGLLFCMGSIQIPPLRERKADVAALTERFITQYNREFTKNVSGLDSIALSCLLSYNWPGNVYELQHVIQHAICILPDEASQLTADYLPSHILTHTQQVDAAPRKTHSQTVISGSLNNTIQNYTRAAICEALKRTNGNISQSARLLQMSRQSLQYRIKRYQINIDSIVRNQSASRNKHITNW